MLDQTNWKLLRSRSVNRSRGNGYDLNLPADTLADVRASTL
jgi:hypothetical protein